MSHVHSKGHTEAPCPGSPRETHYGMSSARDHSTRVRLPGTMALVFLAVAMTSPVGSALSPVLPGREALATHVGARGPLPMTGFPAAPSSATAPAASVVRTTTPGGLTADNAFQEPGSGAGATAPRSRRSVPASNPGQDPAVVLGILLTTDLMARRPPSLASPRGEDVDLRLPIPVNPVPSAKRSEQGHVRSNVSDYPANGTLLGVPPELTPGRTGLLLRRLSRPRHPDLLNTTASPRRDGSREPRINWRRLVSASKAPTRVPTGASEPVDLTSLPLADSRMEMHFGADGEGGLSTFIAGRQQSEDAYATAFGRGFDARAGLQYATSSSLAYRLSVTQEFVNDLNAPSQEPNLSFELNVRF
jgi:hypothetical protein